MVLCAHIVLAYRLVVLCQEFNVKKILYLGGKKQVLLSNLCGAQIAGSAL